MNDSGRQSIFRVRYAYDNPFDQRRASGVLILNWVMLFAWAVWLAFVILPALTSGQELRFDYYIWTFVPPFLAAIIYWATQTGRLRLATWLFVALFTANTAVTLLNGISGTQVIISVLPLIAAGLLLDQRSVLVVAIIIFIAALAGTLFQSELITPVTHTPADLIVTDMPLLWITLGLVMTFLYLFGGATEAVSERLLTEVRRLHLISELESELTNIDDENAILARTVTHISQDLGFVFAAVYSYDASGYLNARMRTDIGRQQTEGYDRFSINSANILSTAARNRQIVVASTRDSVESRSHFLPSTTFGAAIPLLHRNNIVGVLDVQSAFSDPFSDNDLAALGLLANDLAALLNFIQVTKDLQFHLNQQEQVAAALQAQIAELRQGSQRSIAGDWLNYLQGRGTTALGFDIRPGEAVPIPANNLPETIRPALERGDLVVETIGNEQIINVPITFRDEVLGAMAFAIPADEKITERQIEMARNVSNRLALALENARLFEQTQAQALRERRASEISGLLIGATDVDTVMKLAAESFNEALGAVYTRVYLQPRALGEPTDAVKG